ncbi:MAG: HEAT repeat domain-containing protein [Candidatus Eisenbacteria bacterium]|nr:HEAT repeat domain-containing protein [Candidatus Eisenbacteria bacterium]
MRSHVSFVAVFLMILWAVASQAAADESAQAAVAQAAADESPGTEAEPDTSWIVGLSPEELFLRASSSALQFQSMIEPSRRRLIADHGTSLPYLATRLDTDDARERNALEDILVRIGEPAVWPIIDAFQSEITRTDTTRGARLAASVLGRLEDPAAVPALAGASDHADWKVRGAVAGALGRMGVEEAVPALIDLLGDGNEIVRKSAAFGLGRTASKVHEACGCEDGLSSHDWEPAVNALVGALDDQYYAVRYDASDALSKVGSPALTALRAALKNGSETARLMALRALGGADLGDDAGAAISGLLDSDDWVTRAFAVEAAGRLGPSGTLRRDLERRLEREEHPLVLFRLREALSTG